jgi:PAS domain S-box-containing protein
VVSEEAAPTIHGERRYLTTRFPVVDDKGFLTGIGAISVDVTEQRAAEAALRESAARLRAIYESEPECVALIGDDGAVLEINPAGLAMMEGDPATLLGRRFETMVEPAYLDRFQALVAKVFSGDSGSLLFELIGLGGSRRRMEMNAVPLRNSDGAITAMLGIARDVTAQHVIEEQLRQAQKMEAVGQLTGGIAHDFNNLLGVIVGNLDLLSLKLARHSAERELVERAVAAAERGGALTHRLLAFARRQTLLPQQVNPGVLVTEVAQLLRRTLGERIELTVAIDAGLWDCYVDPGQLETALVNLAINARDAMPDGGGMKISARNATVGADGEAGMPEPGVSPGRYVVISVADTGQGMEEAVRARAFEPFFTTKGVGRGSGLGLSMVHGFVEQSGGHVRLDSAPGSGTSVSLYLRASEVARTAEPAAPARLSAHGGGQLVLVVEDDAEMRSFAVDALHRLGYRTVAAADAADALSALHVHADIVALFTDIVLPGALDGFALAQQVRRERPDVQVLYTSGFADSDKLPPELLAGEADLLPKPYRISELGKRLERLLKREKRPVA